MKQGIDSFPSLSSREMLILRMLQSAGEMYGLEMVEASGGRLKRGTIYVTLGRMEDDKGLVTSRLEPVDEKNPGPRRRLYTINGLGVRTLRFWESVGTGLSA